MPNKTREINWNHENKPKQVEKGGKEKKGHTEQIESKQKDDIFKLNDINKHIKCKWSKHFQLKEEIVKWDRRVKNNICLQETHFKPKDTNKLKVKVWKIIYMVIQIKKIHHSNTKQHL